MAKMKIIRGMFAILAALGSVGWAAAVPAAAGVTPTAAGAAATSVFRNVSTGFCLDSNAEGNAYTLACNGDNFQNWQHR